MPRGEAEDLFTAAPLPIAPLDDAQRIACLRLIRSENVGPATFRALVNHFGGAGEALKALPDLGRRAGRAKPVRIYPEGKAEAEIEAAAKAGVRLLFTIEPGYPAPLAFTEGAPPLLYARGRVELLERSAVAIVGSRNASSAGLTMARMMAAGLGQGGQVVASGLARGVDAAAHQGALETGTVAVLAGGLDVFYPPENRALQARIGEEGCLISEQPLGFQPRAQDFPRRNRIISGISLAVVVIEAAKRSGTLITARLANEQGREVFAVPGHPLDPRAEGTNQLLKDGASMATSADDILEVLLRQQSVPGRRSLEEGNAAAQLAAHSGEPGEAARGHFTPGSVWPVSSTEAAASVADGEGTLPIDRVRQVLGPAPSTIDEVTRATGLRSRDVQVALMELALAGEVELHGRQLVSLRAGAAGA